MFFRSAFLSLVVLGGAFASNVVELTPDNFDEVIGKGTPGLVEFFAPWCGHCKNLAPTYEQLADAFAHKKDKVVVAKIDADGVGKPLGSKYGVTGFPTLKWFDANGEATPYEGGRELTDLANFITSKSGVKSNIKPPPPPATVILDIHTFDEVVTNPDHDTIVTFTAPWCGHCKRLKPIYEDVAKTFLPETNCIVANVDGDAEANRPLALKYGIQSFPTIKFFPQGSDDGYDYEGERTEEALVKFLNDRCGTQRAVGGGLNDKAGRTEELDDLANRFFVSSGAARDAVFAEAKELAVSVGPLAKHYVRVMEKVVNGTEDYVEKESKRLASIIKKRTLSPAKLDEIKVKANVLAAFTAEKVEEAAEAFERATEEL
ncbi:hypothetical protein EVG20_g3826 [Dentipellis fragilis]|uniref:protein disulfide-isomerase n=1 Tax=Dentipellis fragilis TaxID=205917 RepID=A0A4Y9YZG4_9AGAM|nr:hypothetical protein EVG20_g3826 [Dentipellis fragilis]